MSAPMELTGDKVPPCPECEGDKLILWHVDEMCLILHFRCEQCGHEFSRKLAYVH